MIIPVLLILISYIDGLNLVSAAALVVYTLLVIRFGLSTETKDYIINSLNSRNLSHLAKLIG